MPHRSWTADAIRKIEADFNRCADTHLIPLDLPGYPDIQVYFKDESSHPTGSLKHRLARSLFLFALANGWLRRDAMVIEASSGSTAVSEAYFARLLEVPFTAVIPRGTSPEKVAAIEFHGGHCHWVDSPSATHDAAVELAAKSGGHFMDQFMYAERATDWRANNNIAESIFAQMSDEPNPVPAWLVCGAGTGGTSATLGRYVRYRRHATNVLCADPEGSVFFDYYGCCRRGATYAPAPSCASSRIEGIGRPRVEASFLPGCVDAMVRVPDALSLSAMRYVSGRLARRVGGSTGTNFIGVLAAMHRMQQAHEAGSIVTLICDGGERYAHSYYEPGWYALQGLDIASADRHIQLAVQGGELPGLASMW